MTWANEEKNGMDNLKIMDDGKGIQPARGVCQVMICYSGGAAYMLHSLKIILWLMSNLLFLRAPVAIMPVSVSQGAGERNSPLAKSSRIKM